MKTIRFTIKLVFVLGIVFLNKGYGQTPESQWTDDQEFCRSDKDDLVNIWGSGISIPGIYFKEHLPALFKRRLAFSKSDLKTTKLKWIFTGEDGGVTITISSDSIALEQRYYDSFGFNSMKDGEIVSSRYPQSQFTSFKTDLKTKSINSVALEMDDGLGLKLFVNDTLITEQTTQLDFSRHQLLIDGLKLDVCGKLQVPRTTEVAIMLDTTEKHQEILGFGGITSPVAYNMLSAEGKEKWWDFLKEYNLLIQREYPMGFQLNEDFSNWDTLEDATPHYYGDNFPNGEVSDFGYNRKIQQMGGMVVFEFWKFPEWMVNKSASEEDSNAVPLYDKYTAAIVDYCEKAKEKTGKAPAIVGIQNEVEQPAEVWQQMTLALRKALDKNRFDEVKIHMHNGSRLKNGIAALNAFTSDKKVWEAIDYSASNLYDYQNYFTDPDGFDNVIEKWNASFNGQPKKPFISTEMCINDSKYQSGSYRVAFLMGELYHKNMVQFDAVSMMYCWLLVNTVQPSFSASRSLFTIDRSNNNLPIASSYQLRVFGAFSKHLLKGMHRIGATSSDKNLLVSAYSNGEKNTVIILNRDTEPKEIDFSEFGNISMMETVSPYQENRTSEILDSQRLVVAPGSIVTLY